MENDPKPFTILHAERLVVRGTSGKNVQKKWAVRGSGHVRRANSKRGKQMGRRTRAEQEAKKLFSPSRVGRVGGRLHATQVGS
jgi:hypothetical protein